MRYLGIDYGTKRIGVATSDEGGTLAFPEVILDNDKNTLESLQKIIEGKNIGEIVVGESVDFKGAPNPISQKIEEFISELEQEFNLPVRKEKEFLTSVEARRFGKARVDASAAALILQRYLDRKNLI
ncbi:hypothetical protein A2933_01055 [Candidatus Nomurabacteria bacterium RIFCSPLOWO2_01_FULL_46_18]|uniref:Putative pre-16S rRNA nuclease n=1 Tax=Candidatus Nomurabacteria bacterium RIFCSPLOWO2_01_FULL_46_18 TaxID=1801783 RepID=A0A1F6XEQ7_9BACT|nr:MAG: hypothetical protein A2933_01055 [Candidatus Nomurabacteria bacterium RIFCSPLOWO2_01_FULL_46_18]